MVYDLSVMRAKGGKSFQIKCIIQRGHITAMNSWVPASYFMENNFLEVTKQHCEQAVQRKKGKETHCVEVLARYVNLQH